MGDNGVLPPSGVQTGNSWADTLNNAFAYTISRAVDSQFPTTPTVNSDPFNSPSYDSRGNAFNRGAPTTGTGQPSNNSTLLMVGAGVLLLVIFLARK